MNRLNSKISSQYSILLHKRKYDEKPYWRNCPITADVVSFDVNVFCDCTYNQVLGKVKTNAL